MLLDTSKATVRLPVDSQNHLNQPFRHIYLSSVMICFLMAGFTSRWIIFFAMIVPVAKWRTQWTTLNWNEMVSLHWYIPLHCQPPAHWSFQSLPQTLTLPAAFSVQRRTPAAFSVHRQHPRWPNPLCWAWWWQGVREDPWHPQAGAAGVGGVQGEAAAKDHQGCWGFQALHALQML